ncbi:MAG: amidohydrolase family protein [Candidatus Krumholzibacteriia bacterium]
MLPLASRRFSRGAPASRTLITNARLLTLHPGAEFVEPASLVLQDGIVGAVLEEPEPRDAHAEVLDAAGALVLPGFVNAHTHCYGALVRGLNEPIVAGDFAELLRSLWWRLDAELELEDVDLSATLAALDGLRLGVTSVFDHHASYSAIEGSLDAVARGLEAAGQRGVLCFEVSDRAGPGAARAALGENARYARQARRLPFHLGAMLGLHASFTLSDATLEEAAGIATGSGLRMHIHAAEDRVDRVPEASEGTGVVERLDRFGLLQPGSLVAHGVHLGERELRRLGERGVVVVHNPRSNMNNGVGTCDVGALVRAGIQVALGTDAYGAGMLAEARTATLVQRQHPRLGDGGVVSECLLQANPQLVSMLLPGAGRLRPGSPADVVVTRYLPPTPLDAGNAWGHLLFGDVESRVRSVFVAGHRVIDEGCSTRLDEREISGRCRERAARLWTRFRDARPSWQRVDLRGEG